MRLADIAERHAKTRRGNNRRTASRETERAVAGKPNCKPMQKETDMQEQVAKLNEAKKAKKMTLKQLAEKSGLSQGTVNKIMSGELKSIKPDKLAKLARALDVAEEYLLGQAASKGEAEPYLGLVCIACISPEVRVGDCDFNARQIVRLAQKASDDGVKIALFPELCITGYSCGDMFFQSALRSAAVNALDVIRRETAQCNTVCIVGLPLCDDLGKLYNVGAALFKGEILGVVPKINLPNYNEFFEKRLFCPYNGENTSITLLGKKVPFGSKLIFADTLHHDVRFALEICEDVWVANSPSIRHACVGANAVFNLSASNETVAKSAYRKKMIEIQSAKCGVIYAYCSSGMSESTSQTVFSAHNIICENGECIAECAPFTTGYAQADADFDFIANERAHLDRTACDEANDYTVIPFELNCRGGNRRYSATPFVPENKAELDTVCAKTLNILAYGLKKRIEHVHADKLVLGISGGSDSTLALLVCKEALRLAGRGANDIVAVTMPCFGTSKRTFDNSVALANAVGATLRQIDISSAVTQHLNDIGHDFAKDTVYENAQARERTQVLMDIANACNGLVVGTGDMSEAALGWSTFNGDQMSMYAAIASVPKTLVKAMLVYCKGNADSKLKAVLKDIIDTPVSPELLPADSDGNITQITEDVIGPYELHDYFLFMFCRKGFAPKKIFELAKLSFAGRYDEQTILDRLKFFFKRFFSQQFKRSCAPDSVRLGSVDLSKYGLRMPSDASCRAWLAELDELDAR